MNTIGISDKDLLSRPARGGWIEIGLMDEMGNVVGVPPRTGRVD